MKYGIEPPCATTEIWNRALIMETDQMTWCSLSMYHWICPMMGIPYSTILSYNNTLHWLIRRLSSLSGSREPLINSLWPTLVQVMACCLTAPSHNLNQCWLIMWCLVAFISMQLHRNCPWYRTLKWVWKLSIWYCCLLSQGGGGGGGGGAIS